MIVFKDSLMCMSVYLYVFYCFKCCVSPVELSVVESVTGPSLGIQVCILLCCVLVHCCDFLRMWFKVVVRVHPLS